MDAVLSACGYGKPICVPVGPSRPFSRDISRRAVPTTASASAPSGNTIAPVKGNLLADPRRQHDMLVRMGKLDLGENESGIWTQEAINRPDEAIVMTDLVPYLPDDPGRRQAIQRM